MKKEQCLEEFIRTFKGSLDARLWMNLIKEELAELKAEEYGTEAHLKESADLMYVVEGFDTVAPDSLLDVISSEELDEMMHIMAEANEELDHSENYYQKNHLHKAFLLVHESNMSKLGADGKPIRREDGKVLKGPNYKPPSLGHLL
jgi:predicted HAD superfamily Cof-like phosphohydrolase